MPTVLLLDRGRGPVVVLVHGVGAGPASFDRLAARLEGRHRVVAVERPLGPAGTALDVVDQADRLADDLVARGLAGGLVVGVSGGATVGLALAIRHPEAAGALVLHEPLLGRHAAGLHARFHEAAALAATGLEGAMTVVRSVMGDDTWEALGPHGRAAAWDQAARWQAEIPRFAAFDPTAEELGRLHDRPVLATVGARSTVERRLAAAVLQNLAGVDVVEVPGAGNAAHLDAPDAFASVLEAWHPLVGGRS
ncbi:MAG: alpha/beta hydrolase [Actinobacteria bacterium]|nr:alpha/beta hydrolase [Actinomycetota bacterium]